jgi:hypothetical protein
MKKIDHYFTIGEVGLRVWFLPKHWKWSFYKVDHKRVYNLGPFTIYTG